MPLFEELFQSCRLAPDRSALGHAAGWPKEPSSKDQEEGFVPVVLDWGDSQLILVENGNRFIRIEVVCYRKYFCVFYSLQKKKKN